MSSDPEPTDQNTPAPVTSFAILGARLTWTLLGPLALLGITWGLVSKRTGWFSGLDAAFAIVVGLMALGRWVEQRSGSASTFTGEPATPTQCKRYVAILIPAAAAAWVIANLVGNHLLK